MVERYSTLRAKEASRSRASKLRHQGDCAVEVIGVDDSTRRPAACKSAPAKRSETLMGLPKTHEADSMERTWLKVMTSWG